MAQVSPLRVPGTGEAARGERRTARVHHIEDVRCGLCGTSIGAGSLRYKVVSPRSSGHRMTVCATCRKAVLGEGYRPVD